MFPGVTQNHLCTRKHDYTETLLKIHVTSSMKMVLEIGHMHYLMGPGEDLMWSRSHRQHLRSFGSLATSCHSCGIFGESLDIRVAHRPPRLLSICSGSCGGSGKPLGIQIMQKSPRPLATSGLACGTLVWAVPTDNTDHQAVSNLHSQTSGWKTGYPSLPLKRLPCVFGTLGFPELPCEIKDICAPINTTNV